MSYKVISLNIWEGGKLLPEILKWLQLESPDILALQEVRGSDDPSFTEVNHSFEIIKRELGYPYADFAPAMINNLPFGKVPQGNALLAKYPITDPSVVFFNQPFSDDYVDIPENFATCPRILQCAVIQTPTAPVFVGNVHGVWDLDGDNNSLDRQKMSQAIIDAVKNKPIAIILGDTNAKSTNRAMIPITEQLTSVFGLSIKSTFNMRRKENPGYASAAVDLMYVGSVIRIISKSVPNVDISDHLPIMAELDW